ncbi:MAG TPA: hypothetical protein VE934_01125 [Polaromonas sp.]|uniref:hypothetical protein n=1 Tax=Polaromonas sp. TaxID=1869339 RepID=UPI002D5CA13C|nr:hypothetical protein [Polaromonas sp.]HYW55536.1 hypothetical protein [Polaromonas sp.]
MSKTLKWLSALAVAGVLSLGALVLVLQSWAGSNDFRQRMEAEASAALGLPVQLGSIKVAVWPVPALALESISVQSKPALTLGRVEVRPGWATLLRGRLEIATLVLREVVLPQQAVDAILLALQKKKQIPPANKGQTPNLINKLQPDEPPQTTAVTDWLPRRALLDQVTWVSAKGDSTTLNGEIRLGADNLPEEASLSVVKGHLAGLNSSLQREEANQWALRVQIGGGTVAGRLTMQHTSAAQGGRALEVTGQLETRDVEVAALTVPNKPLSGLLEASTTLSARAATTAGLIDALQTDTSFTVKNAVLHGLDLEKAVKSVGMSRGGQTPLDTLAGQVRTQGRTVHLNNLVATSGLLGATGNVTISPARELTGRISVNLADTVGVPLAVGGTLDAPEVSLSRGALLGAAIGTVLMPGVGTGAGIELGDRVGEGLKKLFGK